MKSHGGRSGRVEREERKTRCAPPPKEKLLQRRMSNWGLRDLQPASPKLTKGQNKVIREEKKGREREGKKRKREEMGAALANRRKKFTLAW